MNSMKVNSKAPTRIDDYCIFPTVNQGSSRPQYLYLSNWGPKKIGQGRKKQVVGLYILEKLLFSIHEPQETLIIPSRSGATTKNCPPEFHGWAQYYMHEVYLDLPDM